MIVMLVTLLGIIGTFIVTKDYYNAKKSEKHIMLSSILIMIFSIVFVLYFALFLLEIGFVKSNMFDSIPLKIISFFFYVNLWFWGHILLMFFVMIKTEPEKINNKLKYYSIKTFQFVCIWILLPLLCFAIPILPFVTIPYP